MVSWKALGILSRNLELTDWPVLSHIISQLRPGADLSRVVLPTFILEPRSMLERITKYVVDQATYSNLAPLRFANLFQLHVSS
jgi:hypothetical protein